MSRLLGVLGLVKKQAPESMLDALKNYRVILCGETHTDPDLKTKYLYALSSAHAMGIRDVAVENVPEQQSVLEKNIDIYRRGLLKGLLPDDLFLQIVLEPRANHIDMVCGAAACFDFNVHAVDVAPKKTLGVMKKLEKSLLVYLNENPTGSIEDYMEKIPVDDLIHYRNVTGTAYTRKQLCGLFAKTVSEVGGISVAAAVNNRLASDNKIAEQIILRIGNKPFVGFFGQLHVLGYAEADFTKCLSDYMRGYYGKKNVVTVQLSAIDENLIRDTPDYKLDQLSGVVSKKIGRIQGFLL